MKLHVPITLLLTILLASACAPATVPPSTPDVSAIYTSAAKTVVAEFTLTAAVFSPTPQAATATSTPLTATVTATATAGLTTDPTLAALGTPAVLCDNYTFDLKTLDVTIPDGTKMTPGQDFIKTWKIKNTGACSWGDGYTLVYSYGEKMGGQPVPLNAVIAPGQEVDVSVNFKAPDRAGEYFSAWQMLNPKSIPFGDKDHILLVKIVVQ